MLLTEFYPKCGITCENDSCKRHFYKYIFFASIIDIDRGDEPADAVMNGGAVNRVKCPFCGCEFTYETPLMIFSQKYKIYTASTFDEQFIYTSAFENALRIAGETDLRLRLTQFAFEAAEKIRLAAFGLSDAKAEMFKLVRFENYKDMDTAYEYIVFDKLTDNTLIFTHRDYTDKILEVYEISYDEYKRFSPDVSGVRNACWLEIDKQWSIRRLEDTLWK